MDRAASDFRTLKGDRIDGNDKVNQRSEVVLRRGRQRSVQGFQIIMSLKMKTRELRLRSLRWDADHRSLLGNQRFVGRNMCQAGRRQRRTRTERCVRIELFDISDSLETDAEGKVPTMHWQMEILMKAV